MYLSPQAVELMHHRYKNPSNRWYSVCTVDAILDNFLSGGKVVSNFRSSPNATLNASTRILSRVACAVLYFAVALRRRRLSSYV